MNMDNTGEEAPRRAGWRKGDELKTRLMGIRLWSHGWVSPDGGEQGQLLLPLGPRTILLT